MRVFALYIAVIIGTSMLSPFGYTKEASVKEFMPGYISIQEALTADDLTLAQTKAKELQEQIQSEKGLKDIKSSLGALQKTKSISDARKEF